MLKNVSIKRKQMLITMVTSGVALLLACASFIAYDVITFRSNMADKLASMATMIADASTAALDFDDAATAHEILGSLKKEQHVTAAGIYDRHGGLFAFYCREPRPANFRLPFPEADGERFADGRLGVFRRVSLKGEHIGTVYVQSDLQTVYSRLLQYGTIVAAVLVAASLVALVLSSTLQKVVSEPILQLAKAAVAVSRDKNYAVRVPEHGRDELGCLILVFNEMLNQIQERDVALQRAHDDLEHRVAERTRELQQEIQDRRRAEVGLHQQLTRISLLNSITRAIADRQDLESIVHVVLRQLEDHLPISFGRVCLFDPQTKTISVAVHGESPSRRSKDTDIFAPNVPLEQTGLQECLIGKTIVFSDTDSGSTHLEKKLSAAGLFSAVAVPLMVENELFGVLLAARREVNAFGGGECEFLRMLSDQVALAAHQARLHTQLQHAYDELRQTQQSVMQEERLRALGQMASGIAHDINNALSPVVVYSELLLRDQRGLDEAGRKKLENIKTAGEDIAHIVSRMREFYRRRDERDQVVLVNVNKVTSQVIELTRPRWKDIPQARGVVVEMKTDYAGGSPAIVGNESELREAVTNLILNGIDAMPNGGQLTVRTRTRGCEPRGQGDKQPSHVLLEVCDTGLGMDEETRRRCLEPFFSTKGKRGTGLGLAMVYGVMERHDGSIEVESQVGHGTTMRLVFPVKTHPLVPARQPTPAPRPLPSLHLLCIDDEPLLRDMLKQLLESGGHVVEVADGGRAGIDLFQAAKRRGEPFDVVITDLGMPHLDGRQVSIALKQESAQTPVIMLTGWGTIMKEDGDVPREVDGVLSKPPKIAELYEMIGRVTRKCNHGSNVAVHSEPPMEITVGTDFSENNLTT